MSGFPKNWCEERRQIVLTHTRTRVLKVYFAGDVKKFNQAHEIAEDATQEGFLRTARAKEPGDFKSEWALTGYWKLASWHAAVDEMKRGGRYKHLDDGLLEILLPPREDKTGFYELLAEAMERLSPEDQEILRLRYAEGLTLQKIREQLGISIAAVRSRLDRALRRLHQILVNEL